MKTLHCIAIALFISFVSCTAQTKADKNNLTATDFKQKIEQLDNEQVLDVRTPEEWAEGTISNAYKMNWFDNDFNMQIEKLDKTKPVMVYCKSGGRSAKALTRLNELGFTEVYNLIGGIGAWKKAELPVVK